MADLSSFVKLSPKEAVLDSWEIVDDKGYPTLGEVLMGLIVWIVAWVVLNYTAGRLLHEFLLNLRIAPAFFDFLIVLLEGAIPGLLLAWMLFTRPRLQGQLCLTNWRLLYYAHGQNMFRNLHYASAADLDDVLGIQTFYTEGLFGKKTLQIYIHTRFREEFNITAGQVGTIFSMLPLIGKLFLRNTLGQDALVMLPVLYSRIRQHTGASVDSSLNY